MRASKASGSLFLQICFFFFYYLLQVINAVLYFCCYENRRNQWLCALFFFTEDWSDNFTYQLLIGTGVALMALVLLAAVSYQCSATWKWLMGVARYENDEEGDSELSQQNAIRISHSLPDLQSEPITHEYVQEQKDSKKVNFCSKNKISCESSQ